MGSREKYRCRGGNMVLTMEPLTTLVRKVSGGLNNTKENEGNKAAEVKDLKDKDDCKSTDSVEDTRGTWGSKWDFAFSCIAYAVGLGNVWRFPYLCFKNGGGAFLIPYFIAMFTCGIPLFLLEVSIGQYLGVGGMNVIGQICPIFKGVGYSAIMMVFLENVYYIIIVAWTMFYIANIFYNIGDELPWASCAKGNGTWAGIDCFDPEGNVTFENSDAYLKYGLSENNTMSPVEQYWNNEVLNISSGIDVVGGIRWELVAYLA